MNLARHVALDDGGKTMIPARRSAFGRRAGPTALAVLALLMLVATAPGTGLAQAPETSAETPAASGDAATAPAPAEQPQAEQQPTEQPPANEEITKVQQTLEMLKLNADRVEAAIQREGLTDAELAALRGEIDPVQVQAQALIAQIIPRVQAVEARLKQLGEPPGEGQPPESDLIAAERTQQNEQLTALQAIIKQGRLLSLRAEQLATRIAERRRTLFTDRILERRSSVLNPTLWFDALKATPTVVGRFWLLLSDWSGTLNARLGAAALMSIAGALIVLALAMLPVRRLVLRVAARDPARAQPPRLHKVSAAAWLVTFNVAIPALALALLYAVFSGFDLLPERVDRLVTAGLRAIVLFVFIEGLSWVLLAPKRPTWRLFPLPDAAARRVNAAIMATAAVYAIDSFADTASRVLFAPLSVAVAKDVLTSMMIAILLAIALTHARPSNLRETHDGQPSALFRWPWIFTLAWIGVLAIPVAAILGYLSLASFIAAQLVVGGTIIATLILALRLVDTLLTDGLEVADGAGDAIAAMFGMRRESVVQIGILLSGALRVVLVLIAASFLLVPWGIETKDVFSWLRTAFFGFTIGDITISFLAILLALGIFLVGLVVTRAIQRWLEQRLLPHTRFNIGVRDSLKTAFGYVGIVVAAAIGFTFLGLDLSNLAIVAGALSLGVGFGLQSVVNNFVSGLILLAERPIKAGDWIVVGNEEGYVTKISVRATQIETFDRATVIVPNSDLISGVVKNWMHSNLMGRVRVTVGVSYSADPEKVRDVLLKCAEEHPSVLREPQPRVYFHDFGASSLDFELRAYINNVDVSLITRSDLRFAIHKELKEAGIEIPFPQRDIHLRDIDRIEKALTQRTSRRRRGEEGT
jgi:potassium-dependent mechanosensitive channel